MHVEASWFALLSLSLRSSVIVAGIAYGPVPGSTATSSQAFEWPGGLRTFGTCQCFVGRIMSFQGTLGSTLKAFTEAEKDLASDLAKRTDKVHAELSFVHYHWQRFSFTCGFAFKVSTAGIEASIFLVGAAYTEQVSAAESNAVPTRRVPQKQKIVQIPEHLAGSCSEARQVLKTCQERASKAGGPVRRPGTRQDRGPAAPSRAEEGAKYRARKQAKMERLFEAATQVFASGQQSAGQAATCPKCTVLKAEVTHLRSLLVSLRAQADSTAAASGLVATVRETRPKVYRPLRVARL